jgi:hypothetical protein
MKKLLALFLAALFVFSTATLFVSAASPKPIERDEKNIIKMDFLDFNAESNALWAKEKEDGKGWECTISYGDWEWPQDEDGIQIAPYLTSSYRTNTEFSFIENGEVLHFEVTGANDNPGLYFILDEAHDVLVPVGAENGDNPKAEYVKMRVRNYSTASRFSFGFAANQTNNYKFVNATISDMKSDMNNKEYKSASGEWETYIFSMRTINLATDYEELLPTDLEGNKQSRWGGNLEALILFPFGINVTDGTGPYIGASIDIDYIVLGSLDYVTNYKSELERKEESITKLELVKEPTKKNYYVGESLDLDGLELKATYSDGTTEILNSTSYTAKLETEGKNVPVTLTFGAQKATYNVDVTGVTSIEVVETPADTTYEAAEVASGFSPDGFTFKVNYTDGTSRTDFPVTAFRCSGADLTTAGTKNITANFYGIKTNFDINVINVTDVEITAPTKSYRYKDTVSTDDISVNFVYNDGTVIASGDATTELEYTIEADTKATGEVMAKLTATNATYGINITKEFPINVETPVALKISSEPLKTTYQPGDTFDKAGLGVAFLYEDGKTAILDEGDYTARANLSAPGDAKVNIKCSIEGLDDLKLDENYTVKVEGEVANTDGSSQTSATRRPTTGDKDKSEGISPVIIVVIIVAVLAVAGVAVVLVVLKKKKK